MEIPKGLGEFIARDLVFMAGGGLVTASVLMKFDRLPTQSTPAPFFLLALAGSYATGFAIQELFSILRVVTTQDVLRASRPVKWLYARYSGEEWVDGERPSRSTLRQSLDSLTDRGRAAHERVIMHMMIGSTLGPSCLLSAAVLFWDWRARSSAFALALALGGSIIGLMLVFINRMKAMQVSAIQRELVSQPQRVLSSSTV